MNHQDNATVVDALALRDPRIEALHDYWSTKRVGGKLPRRADIDPVDIPKLLPHLLLVDVEHNEPLTFRFRLVGTAVVDLYGQNFTGRYLDEIQTGGLQSVIRSGYEAAVEKSEAQFQVGQTDYQLGGPIEYCRVVLPLAGEQDRVDILLVGTFFSWPDGLQPVL